MKMIKPTLFILTCGSLAMPSLSQTKKVIGKITAYNQYPVYKADISVKSTKETIKSDSIGIFEVSCREKDKITITANGFFKQSVNTKGLSDTLFVNLVFKGGEKNKQLATDHGHVKEYQLSYGIKHLTDENYKQEFFSNIFEMLQSRVTGVQVSGESVNIRGRNTLQGPETPLFVVDGFVVNFNYFKNIDPQSVKSIEVLKEAAATSRFGSRGMHGVIMVTLKKDNT
ncbi:MAG: TonB-dependent receptor plug domain-containing protein [Marinilabiliaceae bacterium]|nr:TonB-dependent receptor plug domain-containing protein [Marinilabiliaceae bacterium]